MAKKIFYVFVILGSITAIIVLCKKTHVQPDTCQHYLPFDIVKQIAVTADKSNPMYISQFQTDYYNCVPATLKKKTIDLYSNSPVYGSFITINGTFKLITSLNLKPPVLEHVSHLEKISDSPSSWLNISKDANLSLETLIPESGLNGPVIVIIIGHYPNSSLFESTFIGPVKSGATENVRPVINFLLQKDFNKISYAEARKMLDAQEYWKIFIGLARIKAIEKQNSKEHSLEIDNILIVMGLNDDSIKNVKSKGTLTILDNAKIALIEKNMFKDWTMPKIEQFLNQMNKEKIKAVDYFLAMRNLPPICRTDITDELFKEATVNPNVKNELVSELISFIKTALPAQQEPVLIEINKLLSAEARNPALSLDQLYAKYNPDKNDYDHEAKTRELEDFLKWDKYDYGKQHYTLREKELLDETVKVIGSERWKWNIKNCLEPQKELTDTLNELVAQHRGNDEYKDVVLQYKQIVTLLKK